MSAVMLILSAAPSLTAAAAEKKTAWLKGFCEREGVPFKGLHSFRHTVATQSIVNGVDVSTVSAILGHSNVSTTLNIYTHAVRKAKAKAANVMAGLIDENDP